ncbi:MAG: polyamine aminopropyltransferase [Spirochaetia bacterium]|nr:polyamine aminopropyltransferase [Spirochaetia bacterium]
MGKMTGKWCTETYRDTALSFKIKKKLYAKRSKFQMVEVYETEKHGNLMALDGCYMVSTAEEFVYHDMLTHIPMFAHPDPKDVLVIGGGDGGTVREVMRHKGVNSIDFVEIDGDVYTVSKKYFPALVKGLEQDKRVHFKFGDGIKFVKESKNKYDVILIDGTDPSDIAGGLFGTEFFKDVYNALKKDGVMCMQSEDPWYDTGIIKDVQTRLRKVFKQVHLYLAFIPIYPSGMWSFSCASKKYDPRVIRNKKSKIEKFRYYTPELHRAAFALPRFVKDGIK